MVPVASLSLTEWSALSVINRKGQSFRLLLPGSNGQRSFARFQMRTIIFQNALSQVLVKGSKKLKEHDASSSVKLKSDTKGRVW